MALDRPAILVAGALATLSPSLPSAAAIPHGPAVVGRGMSVPTPTVDLHRVAPVQDLTFEREGALYRFEEGAFHPVVSAEGKELGAVFIGKGRVTLTSDHPVEQAALYSYTFAQKELSLPFHKGMLLYGGRRPLQLQWIDGEGEGPRAQEVLEARLDQLRRWSSDVQAGGRLWNVTAPNIDLDLAQAALSQGEDDGFLFMEVDARPRRGALYRGLGPGRWWISLYERDAGILPLFRSRRTGVVFLYGRSRGVWRGSAFGLYDRPGREAPVGVDVLTADQSLDIAWDGQFDRLKIRQRIDGTLAEAGEVIRLEVLPFRSLSFGELSGGNLSTHRVSEVRDAAGEPLDFLYQGGQLLISAGHPVSALSLDVNSDVAVYSGSCQTSGALPIPSIYGYTFDRVAHHVTTRGAEDLTLVVSADSSWGSGVTSSAYTPALSVGSFEQRRKEIRGATPVELLTQGEGCPWMPHDGSQDIFLATSAEVLRFMERIHGPLPLPTLNLVQGSGRYQSPGMVDIRGSMVDVRPPLSVVATLIAAQWWEEISPYADPMEDTWLVDTLTAGLGYWTFDEMVRDSPNKELILNALVKDGAKMDLFANKALLTLGLRVNDFERSLASRGHLAFNNLRKAVGDDALALALRQTFAALEGRPWRSAELVDLLGRELDLDLRPLLLDGVLEGPVRGSLKVQWSQAGEGSHHLLRAAADGGDAGPTLGATVYVTLMDMREIPVFVPVGQAVEREFDQAIRAVSGSQRDSGLVRRVKVSEGPAGASALTPVVQAGEDPPQGL